MSEHAKVLRDYAANEAGNLWTRQYDAMLDGAAALDEVARLRADQQDWRKGVALIASALGTHTDDLCCVRISEVALNLRAKCEQLEADLAAVTSDRDTWKSAAMDELARRKALGADLAAAREREGRARAYVAKVNAEPLRVGEPAESVQLGRFQVADELDRILAATPEPAPAQPTCPHGCVDGYIKVETDLPGPQTQVGVGYRKPCPACKPTCPECGSNGNDDKGWVLKKIPCPRGCRGAR